jgi:adenine deaminase
VEKGIDVFHVLKAACINPVLHYKLDVGLLKVGDPADFIAVKDLENFEVLKTYINGILVAEDGVSKISLPVAPEGAEPLNNFHCTKKKVEDFAYPVMDPPRKTDKPVATLPVIEAVDGQLITNKLMVEPKIIDGKVVSDVANDILKIVVVNRYYDAPVAVAFIKNFGLKKGAIASSVAHDSHNVVAVGVDDKSICEAVNLIIEGRGGVSLIAGPSASSALRAPSPRGEGSSSQQPSRLNQNSGLLLPLPVAGLMSAEDGYAVAEKYGKLDAVAKGLGCTLSAPFMTLSFMALLVIPHLKLSDKGLFDGDRFELTGK